MIYTTGTVNAVSGSAIVRGTGTKFKNNNPAINIGMTILIKSGNTNIPYMIKSVNSDTELVLAQPALATATNTTFSIHITEPDNNSDAARTMVAINAYTQYFLDAMNTWMSETGQTKIEMPNGEVITLDSIKKMQGDISRKLSPGDFGLGRSNETGDKHTQDANSVNYTGFATPNGGNAVNYYNSYYPLLSMTRGGGADGSGNNSQVQASPEGVAYRYLGNGRWSGWLKLMEISSGGVKSSKNDFQNNGFYTSTNIDGDTPGTVYMGIISAHATQPESYQMGLFGRNKKLLYTCKENNNWVGTYEVLHLGNAKPDSNGFYKKASPIIGINPDGTFTTNDESEGATVTRVSKGEYLIEGVLGFNADAGWGGVDGGIEIPLDVNKQPLIWVDSEVMEDGSILVRTYHRTHPNAPEFANNKIDGFNNDDPMIFLMVVLFPFAYRCLSNQSIT